MCFIKKIAWLLLASFMIFACDDDDGVTPPPPPPPPPPATEYFEADLDITKVSGHPVEYDPAILLNVTYKGLGSSNLMPALSLEANHIEDVVTGNRHSSITKGNFILKGQQENLIFGVYSGRGYQNANTLEITWNFKIRGGAGKFEGAQGNLQVVIRDPHAIGSNLNQTLVARISGSISVPESSS